MKNLYISAFIFLGIINLKAQVGINMIPGNTPQEALHVSGSSTLSTIPETSIQLVTPTIRIDGLNNTNQSTSEKLRAVSVTDNGDLVLSNALVVPILMIDPINTSNIEDDYLTDPVIVDQVFATSTDTVLRSFTFTLQSPSFVKFGATTSFQFYNASDGSVITDGANRIWGTRFRFSSAPPEISTAADAYFGESLKGYTNLVNNASATGILYANSEEILALPAGDYIVDIISSISTQSTQAPARIINGNGNDNISIVAYPI